MTLFKKMTPLILKGSPFERGMLQAKLCPEMVGAVREHILSQVNANKELLQSVKTSDYLKEQVRLSKTLTPEIYDEVRGIAKGFELEIDDLFGFYHLGIVLDMDGCTSWAVSSLSGQGAAIGKNRDQAAGNHALQRVFLHQNPDGQQTEILTVGSLGAPCAYSSGINSHGFCLADTNILTSDHGPGICRFFLMPYLLATCTSTEQALTLISDIPHAGGGSLTLGDKYGKIAVVELGHSHVSTKENGPWVAKTNHFDSDQLGSSNLRIGRESEIKDSEDRLCFTKNRLNDIHQKLDLETAIELQKSHGEEPGGGICVHPGKDTSATISGAVYSCLDRKLYFSDGNPCNSPWYEFSF